MASTAANLHAWRRNLWFCSMLSLHTRAPLFAFSTRSRVLERLLRIDFTWPWSFGSTHQLSSYCVVAPRQRLDLDFDCYSMLPFFLNRDLDRRIVDLSKNHFKTSDSTPVISPVSSEGPIVSSGGSFVWFYAIVFPSFYKTASSCKIWVKIKKFISNKSILFFSFSPLYTVIYYLEHLLRNHTSSLCIISLT